MSEYVNEASLDQTIIDRLKKKGIVNIINSSKELNNSNAIIDTSNINYKDESSYIKKLIGICKEVKGYKEKYIYISLSKWFRMTNDRLESSNTPVGIICKYIKSSPVDFKKSFEGFVFVFFNDNNESFALYADKYKSTEYKTVINLIDSLVKTNASYVIKKDTDKSPVKDIEDKEKIAKEELESKKQDLVDALNKAAENSSSEEEAWEKIEQDAEIARLIAELDEEDDGRPQFNATRTARNVKLNDEFLNMKINGKLIKDIIEDNGKVDQLPKSHLKVSSINEEWQDVGFVNFENMYNINADIFAILKSLHDKSYPVEILDIKIEDTSTKMDYIDTYTVSMEDSFNKRFTLVFDIPKFKNNRFMRLRGNEKVMSGQLVLLPCLKTDEDTVQCVSNYNKIFIRRKGLQGRSYPYSDKLIKALYKFESNSELKIFTGDNKAICSKYELPADYIDIASAFSRIETKNTIYFFNQDEYRNNYSVDNTKGIPYSINKADSTVNYYQNSSVEGMISQRIATEICDSCSKFKELYKSTKIANTLSYSEASILSNKIPLIVVLGYSLGLEQVMKMLEVPYTIVRNKEDTMSEADKENLDGRIKFSDGFIAYKSTYVSSMLLNGLSVCGTEAYSINDFSSRSMWLDFLDDFGGRILSDGLDNFADLFIDPITKEVCEHCKIPSDYFKMLIYANGLLADNKYNRHTDISGNRYRTNELVAGYFYKAISKSYTEYKAQVKRGKKVGMTIKRSAVIDGIFEDPMSSDLSVMNPLLEIEAANSVSFKGLSGMNSDRSYGLDKRTYDDSMINKLALSTGFAANVGINRQTTIDMDIEGKRGYIKSANKDDMSITKTFSMTEALTPFGTTRETI